MFLRFVALVCGCLLLAASAKPITLPGRGGVAAEPRARTFAVAPTEEGGPPPGAHPDVEKVTAKGDDSVLRVHAMITAGRAPVAVLQRDGANVARVALTDGGGGEWGGSFDVAAGDYRITVKDGTSAVTSELLTARVLPCFGGKRQLVVHEVGPARLRRTGSEPYLEIPRWYRADQEYSFVVEWLRDGKLVYETSGRTDHLEQRLALVEGTYESISVDKMCGFDFGELYRAPVLPEGTWEVRVHREGAESLTASFDVHGREPPIDLQLRAMPMPAKAAGRIAHIPAACTGAIKIKDLDSGEQSWWYGWEGCEAGHTGTGEAVPASAAEYRALMRDGEAFEIRTKMAAIQSGEGPIARPDFEYDSEKSPDTNWRRKRAWDKVDTDRQFTNERILASRARAKYGAALAASVKRHGGAWRPDEIPAPVAGWPAQ